MRFTQNSDTDELQPTRKLKRQLKNKKSTRRALLVLGGLTAVGVGAYFGTKKPLGQIVKSVGNAEAHLKKLVDYTYFIEDNARSNMGAIDSAIAQGIDFTYYPGLGVHSLEMNRIRGAVTETAKAVKKAKK